MICPKVTEILLCLTYLVYLCIFLLLFPKGKFQINKLQKKTFLCEKQWKDIGHKKLNGS